MQESNKVESAVQVQNEVKQDEFRVGDVVWCLHYGKGVVSNTESFIEVDYGWTAELYTPEGVHVATQETMPDGYSLRTLFFSEPKIEASVTRPFVPTLVGKRVVVQYYDGTWIPHPVVVTEETEEEIFTKNGSDYKSDLIAIREVSSENLLTSKK